MLWPGSLCNFSAWAVSACAGERWAPASAALAMTGAALFPAYFFLRRRETNVAKETDVILDPVAEALREEDEAYGDFMRAFAREGATTTGKMRKAVIE